ncbi:unnamed protein product, partial [Choristocarpus tenellus]
MEGLLRAVEEKRDSSKKITRVAEENRRNNGFVLNQQPRLESMTHYHPGMREVGDDGVTDGPALPRFSKGTPAAFCDINGNESWTQGAYPKGTNTLNRVFGSKGVAGVQLAQPSSNGARGVKRKAGKWCGRDGCSKGSLFGGFCAAHGGGLRCTILGCDKIDIGGGYCAGHGGGARCQEERCPNVAQGKGVHCRMHGGGRFCRVPLCSKVDVGRGLCRRHGGGKRCGMEKCAKTDVG